MNFALYATQVIVAVVDYLVDSRRIAYPVGDAHGGDILAVHNLYRYELAPDPAVNLLITFPVGADTLFDAFLEVVGCAKHDAYTVFELIV